MNLDSLKARLYRTQQYLALTRSEASALLALAAILLAGMGARYVQGRPRALPGRPFAATEARFQQGAAGLRAASAAATPAAASPGTSATAAAPGEAIEPAGGERAEEARSAPATPSASAPLALNEATPRALETLPGVGPVIAGRIVAYRDAHGPFAAVEHLERVRGIGPKTMQRLAPLLTLSAPGAHATEAPETDSAAVDLSESDPPEADSLGRAGAP